MADNTQLPAASGGDTIRTLDRTYDQTGVAGAKTEIAQLDIGGPGTNPESLVSLANPLPVQMNDLLEQVRTTNRLLTAILTQLQGLNASFGAPAQPIDIPQLFVPGAN